MSKPRRPVPLPPAVLVRHLEDAIVAFGIARELKRPVTLLSPEAGALWLGPGWLVAMAREAAKAVPGAKCRTLLDCADRPDFAQAALRSVTVFNFFLPDYTRAGTLAGSGLYAPEFQILTDTTAITGANFYYLYINNVKPGHPGPENQDVIYMTFDELLPLARNPTALVAKINLILAAGSFSQATTDRIVSALNSLPSSADDYERVRVALYLSVISPEGAAQK